MFGFPPLTPFVRAILITLGASLVLTSVLERLLHVQVVALLALSTTLSIASLWQLFTHVLVMTPDSEWAVVFSFVFLWWCLVPFEERYGGVRVLQLSVFAALVSGLTALLVGQLRPTMIGGPGPLMLAAIGAYLATLPPGARLATGRSTVDARIILWINLALITVAFLRTWDFAELASQLAAIGSGYVFVRYWMQRPPRRRSTTKRASGAKLRVVRDDDDDDEPKRWLN